MNISFLNKLNDAQRKAAMHIDGPTYIDAGPGTGKTTTLKAHNLYLMKMHPESIPHMFILTFTKSATQHMKNVMQDALHIDKHHKKNVALPKISTIGTLGKNLITALAKATKYLNAQSPHIIFPYNIDDTINNNLIISNDDTSKFITKLAYHTVTGHVPRMSTVNKFYKGIQWCKRNVLSYQKLGHEIKSMKHGMLKKYARKKHIDLTKKIAYFTQLYYIYKHYEQELEYESLIDYRDMTFLPVILMSRYPDLKNFCQNNVQYMSIDEFQDTDNSQLTLAELLIGKTHNICAVGDTDQSLYTWRGANLKVAKNFQSHYKNDKNYAHIHLITDYRSTQNIVNGSNDFIKHNLSHNKKKYIKAAPNASLGEPIHVYSTNTTSEEAVYVINQIKGLHAQGYKYKDMYVLYRDNKYPTIIDGLVPKFIHTSIPFRLIKADNFFDKKIVKEALKYLSAVAYYHKSAYVARVLNIPKRGISLNTIDKLMHCARQNNKPLIDILVNIQSYKKQLHLTSKRQQALHYEALSIISSRQYLMNAPTLYSGVERSIQNSYLPTRLKTKYHNTTKRALARRCKRQLASLRQIPYKCKQIVKNYHKIASKSPIFKLSTFLTVARQNFTTSDASRDAVTLSTIHAAKGSEASIVFMIGTQTGVFPSTRSIDKANTNKLKRDLESERRVFYVGMTRAKKQLYITHAASGHVYSKWSLVHWSPDSKFIDDIPPKYTDADDTNAASSTFANPFDSKPVRSSNLSFAQRFMRKRKYKKEQKQAREKGNQRAYSIFKNTLSNNY